MVYSRSEYRVISLLRQGHWHYTETPIITIERIGLFQEIAQKGKSKQFDVSWYYEMVPLCKKNMGYKHGEKRTRANAEITSQ